MPYTVAVTTLGENNSGQFGPDTVDEAERARLASANADPQYRRKASNRYLCVDGRCSQIEIDRVDVDDDEYDPQIPGGQAVLESAVEYMTQPAPQPLSLTVAAKTRAAIADGFRVTVHGANKNKAGCAANADMQTVLRKIAANADIVVPIASAVIAGLEFADVISSAQLKECVAGGQTSADNDKLWDVDAAAVADIIVANGGEYIDLIGEHLEGGIRVDLAVGATRKAKLMHDVSTDQVVIEQFIASLGQYKKDTFQRFAKHGKPEAEAARHMAAAVLYTIGISKHLSKKNMPVFLVGA